MNKYYPSEKNKFYVYNYGVTFSLTHFDNVTEVTSLPKEVDLSLMNDQNDKLFIHGFYSIEILRYLFLKYRQIDFKRVVLIIWGADLYDAREKLKEGGLLIMTRINEILKKRIAKKVKLYMTFACADFDLLCKVYDASGLQFDCLYPSSIDKPYLDRLKKEQSEQHPIRIMLGNSATKSNQHIEALDWLSQFQSNPIEIICPLSYGDMAYAKEVELYGKKIFGNKFKAIKEYLKPEEYTQLLNSVDVAVFNNNRQQATANIEILSYLGKKIFIRSDTTTWKHYVERDKCMFYDTLEIQSLDFDSFVSFPKSYASLNENYFTRVWDWDHIKKLWDNVIDYEITD